jgi:glycosyltransferase involved in cell wall biosynthesis/GT2 family glycosyltransferase
MSDFPNLPLNESWQAWPPGRARICIASYELRGPSRNGGIGTGYSALASALAEAGHQVTLLYLFGTWCESGTVAEWQAYYRERGIQFCPLPTASRLTRSPQSIAIALDAYQWLKVRDFDVVHFPELLGHGYYSVLAKHQGLAFANTLICVGVHSPISWIREVNRELPHTVDEPEIDFMERESVALADVVVSPSRYLLGWMRANGWRLPKATYVQQYVLSPELWSVWRERGTELAPQPITGLTFFGRLEERKGLALFCDALDLLVSMNAPRFTVSFLGKCALVAGRDAISYIEERARHWPFAWRIVSDRDQQGALELLREGGRLAVIPSLVDNLPNTVLECLSAGIPLIAARSGGIPEAIAAEDVERVTFPLDPVALAQRLRIALREGVAPARPAVDPEENRERWVAWHNQLRPEAADDAQCAIESREPLISVCLTQPSRPQSLRVALGALEAQSWRNLEIILAVPSGGSDSEIELARGESAGEGPRLRTICRRLGSAENVRDAAAAAARGDCLIFLDEHTVAKPDLVRTLYGVFQRTHADILTSFLDLYTGDSPPVDGAGCGWQPFLGPATIPGIFRNYYGQGVIFLRKEILQRIGGFAADDWRQCDDWEFLTKAVLANLRLKVVPKALAWYRLNGLESSLGNGNGMAVRRLRSYLQILPPAFGDLLKLSLVLSKHAQHDPGAHSNGRDPVMMADDELLKTVRERLSNGGNRRIAAFLDEWQNHTRVRLGLPERRLERLPHVARELFKGNYHRFAHGFGSALRDLRRTPRQSEPSRDR